jgi:uncharacterized membrane protein YqaE (UPF0057 family)
MSLLRVLLCILLPPLAVLDRGCGSILLVLLLTLFGWIPGVIAALIICQRPADTTVHITMAPDGTAIQTPPPKPKTHPVALIIAVLILGAILIALLGSALRQQQPPAAPPPAADFP